MARNTVDGGLLNEKPGPIYFGIDPSLTGFALTAYAPSGAYMSWLYKSPNKGIHRLMDISDWLRDRTLALTIGGFTVADVAVEDTVVSSFASVAMGELAAVVRLACYHYIGGEGSYPVKVPPTMVKKFATNKGNAKKNEVMLGVYKNFGVEFADDNMADSYVIARISAKVANHLYQQDVLTKLADPKFRDPPKV